MNILRELRKFKKKKLRVKLYFVFIFLIMLITSIYAWSKASPVSSINNLQGVVNSWGIEFYVGEEEVLEDYVTFNADEFFPGMQEKHQIVSVHNVGSRPVKVQLEITSVKLFGEEILEELKSTGNITETDDSFTLFSSEKEYPFDVYIKYRKNLEPKDENNIETSIGNIDCNFSWKYSTGNDDLDTEYGEKAFDFYKNNQSDAIEVTLKITAGDI